MEAQSIPDGCTNIIFDIYQFNRILSFYEGTKQNYEPAKMFSHRRLLGIRFLPGMGYKLFKEICAGHVNETIMIDPCVLINDVKIDLERIFEVSDIQKIVCRLDEELQKKARNLESNQFENILNTIYKYNGNLNISNLSKEVFLSTKQLNRLFNRNIGLSAKSFSAIIQFQNAIRHIHSTECLSLAQIALEAGYYDQSHFNSTFKRLYGMCPSQI